MVPGTKAVNVEDALQQCLKKRSPAGNDRALNLRSRIQPVFDG